MSYTCQEKGKSIIAFPEEYIVLDIETTGLNSSYDSITEIACVKYHQGKEVDRLQTLVKPKYNMRVSSFITQLTGITNEMLKDAPSINHAIQDFDDFIQDTLLVGYNVSFDIGFLDINMQEFLHKRLSNNYIDVMRIARKLLCLPHHRLGDIKEYYHIQDIGAHRALLDVITTNECYIKLQEEAIQQYESIEKFKKCFPASQRG